ncbi:hypothetical protein ACFV2X_43645 [Streptomyces sp. NPDC059679]|uniref:hypothetical protein n=1 Tax=Streptomyces sp. NPDC059679 TaxID=3346903 RepID=UPI00368BB092
MSSGVAVTGVDDVIPTFLSQPPPEVPQHIAGNLDIGISDHVGDAVHTAASHAMDSAMDQLHDMVVPALIGLSALGGALLVGRAAMATAQLLSKAVIRAAANQAELEQRQLDACQAAACWKEAAFAAARLNARIDSLHARFRRTGPTTGPDGPPDLPDLPPPLDLNGPSLEQMWRRLAATDRQLRCAEAAYARATMAAAAGPVSVDHPDTDDGWHAKLRDRRRRALEEYEQAATGAEAPPTAAVRPQPTVAAGALTEDEVVRRGAELLATLPHHISAADYRLVEDQIASAAEVVARRPSTAKLHLRQAAHFAKQKTHEAEQRREHEEWAAQQLAFLRDVPPGIPGPLPDATAEIAILEGILDKGGALVDAERKRVEDRVKERVKERVGAYERAYAAEVIRAAVEHVEHETCTHSTSGTVRVLDWTPPDWGDDHWLRVSVDVHGSARVATMHRKRDPAEETDAARALDRKRCAEASQHLEALGRLTKQAGLSLTFDLGQPPEESARPTKSQPARIDRPAPKARTRDDQERRR